MSREMFTQHHPTIGQPVSVAFFPISTTEAGYLIEFPQDVTQDQAELIATFMGRQPRIAGVRRVKDSRRKFLVICKVLDKNWQVLEWLQDTFSPRRRYVAIAQVVTAANPVFARISVVGRVPSEDILVEIANQYGASDLVAFVRYSGAEKELAVQFNRSFTSPDELNELRKVLENDHMNVTLIADPRKPVSGSPDTQTNG